LDKHSGDEQTKGEESLDWWSRHNGVRKESSGGCLLVMFLKMFI